MGAGRQLGCDLGREGSTRTAGGRGGRWLEETDSLAGKACAEGARCVWPPPRAAQAHEPPSSQVYETPFYVAVDHDKKKVVISIRGTLSPKVGCPRLPAHHRDPSQPLRDAASLFLSSARPRLSPLPRTP